MSDTRRRLINNRPCRADDEFIALYPISAAEVRELHEDAERYLDEVIVDGGYRDRPRPTFTCKDCSLNDTCLLAFDIYNTNGDCLLEK